MLIDHYFAYGSNMNPQRMRDRGVGFEALCPARLPGMALRFNKRAHQNPLMAYANIGHAPGEVVEGLLYRLSCPQQILRLDPFEGTPVRYSREVFLLESEMGRVPAWVYVANAAWVEEGLRPARWYLQHLLAGEAWLSPAYHRQLASQCCLEDA